MPWITNRILIDLMQWRGADVHLQYSPLQSTGSFQEVRSWSICALVVGEGNNLNIEPAPSECLWRFITIRNMPNIASFGCWNPPAHEVWIYPSICALYFDGANTRISSDPMYRGVSSPKLSYIWCIPPTNTILCRLARVLGLTLGLQSNSKSQN